MKRISAVIADDEEHLRHHLRQMLTTLWPELVITGEAENGIQALDLARNLKPDILFLDIRMPGLSGMETAALLDRKIAVVFITAYDDFAVAAFEKDAVDYLLKPVSNERLMATIQRLKTRMDPGHGHDGQESGTAGQVVERPARTTGPDYLNMITVQQGASIRMIPVDNILFFRAEDKYSTVQTREATHLIRTPIKDLEQSLNPDLFWRVHRSAIVNISAIDRVDRSFSGRLTITFINFDETVEISRTYAHRFRQM